MTLVLFGELDRADPVADVGVVLLSRPAGRTAVRAIVRLKIRRSVAFRVDGAWPDVREPDPIMELTFLVPRLRRESGPSRSLEQRPRRRSARRACGIARRCTPRRSRDGTLQSCAWCATDDLYLQKDFPQGLGLAIVIVGIRRQHGLLVL